MEGELDGRPEEAQEGQGQPEEPQGQASQAEPVPDYRALLDEQDERIRGLESQVAEVAEAARSQESADALAKEIERLRADSAEERVGYELRIAVARNYTGILDEVYQRASVSSILNSPRRMVRAGRNAKEVMIPKVSVSGLGNYARNVGYKTGSIEFAYETKAFNYDRGIRLIADVMDVEEAGAMDCFVRAGAELQRTARIPFTRTATSSRPPPARRSGRRRAAPRRTRRRTRPW